MRINIVLKTTRYSSKGETQMTEQQIKDALVAAVVAGNTALIAELTAKLAALKNPAGAPTRVAVPPAKELSTTTKILIFLGVFVAGAGAGYAAGCRWPTEKLQG